MNHLIETERDHWRVLENEALRERFLKVMQINNALVRTLLVYLRYCPDHLRYMAIDVLKDWDEFLENHNLEADNDSQRSN